MSTGPPTAGAAANCERMRERLLQATYDCVARWGLAKTTVEDAAREAGVSRATVYRYFPGGREELIGAVVAWEFSRFFLRLYEEVHDAETLEEVMNGASSSPTTPSSDTRCSSASSRPSRSGYCPG